METENINKEIPELPEVSSEEVLEEINNEIKEDKPVNVSLDSPQINEGHNNNESTEDNLLSFPKTVDTPPKKEKRKYRKKENLKRFYFPKEWFNLLKQIKNEKHKFLLEFLLHTGARINEARNVKITDIDFEREQIVLKITKGRVKKGNMRTLQISTYLAGRIKSYINSQKIESKLATLGFPSTPMMDKMIKRYTMLSGIEDWKDFSCHSIRKTLENYLVCLNINHLSIQAHMGHTLDVASAHYVTTQLMTSEDKSLIKAILDNLLQK